MTLFTPPQIPKRGWRLPTRALVGAIAAVLAVGLGGVALAIQGSGGGAVFRFPGVLVTGASSSKNTYTSLEKTADGYRRYLQVVGDPRLHAVLSADRTIVDCQRASGHIFQGLSGLHDAELKGAVEVTYKSNPTPGKLQTILFKSESVSYANARKETLAGSTLTFPSNLTMDGSDAAAKSTYSMAADSGTAKLSEEAAGKGQVLQDVTLNGHVVLDYRQQSLKPGKPGSHYHCEAAKAHIVRRDLKSGSYEYVVDLLGKVTLTGSDAGGDMDVTNGTGWELILDSSYDVTYIGGLGDETHGTVDVGSLSNRSSVGGVALRGRSRSTAF